MPHTGPVNHRVREVIFLDRTKPYCMTCGRPVWWKRTLAKQSGRNVRRGEPYKVVALWKHGYHDYPHNRPPAVAYLFPPTPTGC